MKVVSLTESVLYRIALWDCFGNKIPTLQQSDCLARSDGASPNSPAMQLDTQPTQSLAQTC